MNEQIQEWINLGVRRIRNEVKTVSDPSIPTVVSPVGVEPNKPRAIWDGRYVNEFCRDIPFHMDIAAEVAQVAWSQAYFFKLDHKMGIYTFLYIQNPGNFLGSSGMKLTT